MLKRIEDQEKLLAKYQRVTATSTEEVETEDKGRVEIKQIKPKQSLPDELSALSQVLGVDKLDIMIGECTAWLKQSKRPNPNNLTPDELFAIALYSYDLGKKGKREDNFYFILNNVLRERNSKKLEQWHPYMYHLIAGLKKLPFQKIEVYRGVTSNSRDMVLKEYTQGRMIHWSAFSSTSKDLKTSQEFSGKKGIIFKISVTHGVDIAPYSFIASENEILLSPNLVFTVARDLHKESKGLFGSVEVITLVQTADNIFVF